MRYNIVRDNFKTFTVFNINKLPHRAYFIPFDNEINMNKTTVTDERYNSNKVQLLSGEWDFVYYNKISNAPTPFVTEEIKFDKIKVPSTWQRTGYENPCYLNSRYPFKLNPPNFPTDIPLAVYKKEFLISELDKSYILTFLGACATIEVYLNGDFIGYSEGSHNTAEFDISDKVINGINELLVVVHKWCNGTYLECQDMFRENGIFRDVYINILEKTHINDFEVKTSKTDNGYDMQLSVDIASPDEGYSLAVKLSDKNDKIILSEEYKVTAGIKESYNIVNPFEWSAEVPDLYKLVLILKNGADEEEVIRQYIGFKTVEIKGNIFYFNQQDIKLLGVNHHDTDAENGWVMTAEQLLRDVKLFKEYNCNAIRMSHYPPDPVLLTLCDIYGLYVVDEMDLECHGIYSNPVRQNFGLISNNLEWQGHFLDRAKAMYYRDRNHPSIIMWSLGNESGGYKCHDLCYDFFKSVSDLPIHYEGVIHTKRIAYDVISEMYQHSDKVKLIGEGTNGNNYIGKPYFLCEYAHAMGVGPGAIDEYVKLFYQYDNLMGGCIWEFCDHAVYHKDGKYRYTYGGDHNEEKHDGNFCCDGLFFPDRSPSTGALNMREVYRPVRVEKIDNNKFKFTNYNRFRNSDYITINWDLMCNGESIDDGIIDIAVRAKSHEVVDIKIPDITDDKDIYIIFNYNNKETGEYIASEQIILQEAQYELIKTDNNVEMTVSAKDNIITANFEKGNLVYDNLTGEIVSYTYDGVEYINSNPTLNAKGLLPNIYRGEIDNDRFIKIAWHSLGYHRAKPKLTKTNVLFNANKLVMSAHYNINGIGNIAKSVVTAELHSDGSLHIRASVKKGLKTIFYNDIPRFGLTLEMPKAFENIEYYGLGDRETLDDFNAHGLLGIYNAKVSELHETYIMPQESGNRSQVRYIKITNDNGKGLMIVHKDKYLNFNANHFNVNHILKWNHQEDVTDYDTTCVSIDGFYRGAGSQSCGQGPLQEFRPNIKDELVFEFVILPIK